MWNTVGNASAVATLLGVGATSFLGDATKSHIAFAAFFIALFVLTWRLCAALLAWQRRNYPKGYIPTATFIRFRTGDGQHYLYETYRHIQIKSAFKKTFEHNFFWTGSKTPIIRSALQTVGELKGGEPSEPKTVVLSFKEHRFYNDTEIVHVEMRLDDSDLVAKPFVQAKVDSPMRFIHFRVELLHFNGKKFSNVATLERRPLSASEHAEFTVVEHVNFEQTTKSYEYLLPHPEPGFSYRLRWERVPPRSIAGNRKQ